MGTIAAAIIILALVFYALKDLLIDRDFSAWTNMAITSLILFTVILSIFMVLCKKEDGITDKKQKAVQEDYPASQPSAEQTETAPAEEMSDEEAMLAIAKEYVSIEEDCNKNAPKDTVCSEVATNYIVGKYEFTETEWQAFLQTAAKDDLFNKARAQDTPSAKSIVPQKPADVSADATQPL